MSKISKILLVEDDVFIREMYMAGLTDAGYVVEVAISGPEALDKVRLFKPELILLDILIPVMSGLEVAHTLRTNPEYQALNTKIVMLTNLGHSQAGARAQEEGVLKYLVKADVTPNDLVAHIHAIEEAP